MSHGGGAGKVYFVLYLAVVLELLIIIVERDEAEADLHKKNKESMKIVESILSQLQSGAGTEGINTRPQDEITIPGPNTLRNMKGIEIKDSRKYIVEVGVTDISQEITRKEGETDAEYVKRFKKLIELANVDEMEYQIFYNASNSPDRVPMFPSAQDLAKMKLGNLTNLEVGQIVPGTEGDAWKFLSSRKLKLDKEATFNKLDMGNLSIEAIQPVYPPFAAEDTKGPVYAPPDKQDSAFVYSLEETQKRSMSSGETELKKRSFVVHFKPPQQAGWYKLRFVSRTNRILGVRVDADPVSLDEETTVNIGTVQLTVRDLRKVQRELSSKLEEFGLPSQDILEKEKDLDKFNDQLKKAIAAASTKDKAEDYRSKIRLYGYIAQLLAPGQSSNFDQNKGSIEFNVRVLTPPDLDEAKPTISGDLDQHRFEGLPPRVEFSISPWKGLGENKLVGTIYDGDRTVGQLQFAAAGSTASQSTSSGETQKIIGYSDVRLSAKNVPVTYKVRISHSMGSYKKDTTITLHIYPNSKEDIDNQVTRILKSRAYFGKTLNLTQYSPTSGLYIPENQFRVKFDLDGFAQGGRYEVGYNAPSSLGLTYLPQATGASLKISWVDPHKLPSETVSPELTLYELKNFPIKQEAPTINIMTASNDVSGTEERIKVSIRNIQIVEPSTGYTEAGQNLAKIDVAADIKLTVRGYSVTSKGKPTRQANGTYSLDFYISGTPPDDANGIVKGDATVTFTATATNPNGKVSETSRQPYNFKIYRRFEQE